MEVNIIMGAWVGRLVDVYSTSTSLPTHAPIIILKGDIARGKLRAWGHPAF
jgi:hypothetical protein